MQGVAAKMAPCFTGGFFEGAGGGGFVSAVGGEVMWAKEKGKRGGLGRAERRSCGEKGDVRKGGRRE